MGRKKAHMVFPAARIKRMMQSDEDVGKIATHAPVLVAKALEALIEDLVHEAARVATSRNTKVISPQHLKKVVETVDDFDFLRSQFAKIPSLEDIEPVTPTSPTRSPRRQKSLLQKRNPRYEEDPDYEPGMSPKVTKRPRVPRNAVAKEDLPPVFPGERVAPIGLPYSLPSPDTSKGVHKRPVQHPVERSFPQHETCAAPITPRTGAAVQAVQQNLAAMHMPTQDTNPAKVSGASPTTTSLPQVQAATNVAANAYAQQTQKIISSFPESVAPSVQPQTQRSGYPLQSSSRLSLPSPSELLSREAQSSAMAAHQIQQHVMTDTGPVYGSVASPPLPQAPSEAAHAPRVRLPSPSELLRGQRIQAQGPSSFVRPIHVGGSFGPQEPSLCIGESPNAGGHAGHGGPFGSLVN